MGEGAGIDDDAGGGEGVLGDRGGDFVLAVALAKVDLKAKFSCHISALGFDIRKGLVAIDVRLTFAQQVQVGSVQDENGLAHGRPPWHRLSRQLARISAKCASIRSLSGSRPVK